MAEMFAHDAEQAVLGAMMRDREAIGHAIEILTEDDFHNPAYRQIFKSICAIDRRGETVDLITVNEELKLEDKYNAVGGIETTMACHESVTGGASVKAHARIVRDKTARRRLIDVCQKVAGNIGKGSTTDATDELYKVIGDIQARERGAIRSLRDLIPEADRVINEYRANRGKPKISWGMTALDRLTGGLRAGDYNVIAGRPGFGKTTLALNVSLSMVQAGTPVGFFTMEMTELELTEAIVCIRAGVNSLTLRDGNCTDSEYTRIGDVYGNVSELPFYTDPNRDTSIHQMKARVRRMVHTYGVKVIVVDYMGLIRPDKAANREQEISKVSRGLKIIAQECGVAAIVLCQLNRGVEHREDKTPQLSDMRDSGSIEQDADLVIMPYRPSFYIRDAHPNKTVLFIRKQRRGPTGRVDCVFERETGRFREAEIWEKNDKWLMDEPKKKDGDQG